MAAKETAKKKASAKEVVSTSNAETAPIEAKEEIVVEASAPVEKTEEEHITEEKIETEIEKALEPIKEMADKIKEIDKSQEVINEAITENNPETPKIIKEEIKKAEKLQSEIKKKITNSANFTGWWNGMGYDI